MRRASAHLSLLLIAATHQALAFTCNTTATGGTNDPTVCAALGSLYSSLNGTGWRVNTGWVNASADVATDYCSFYSYERPACVDGAYVALDLYVNKLQGTLPDLSGLSNINYLELGANPGLRGTVPPSIGSLTQLSSVSLCCNVDLTGAGLSGTLPASFASLTALTYLSLAASGLCGYVPGSHQPNDGALPACGPPPAPPLPTPPPAPPTPPPPPAFTCIYTVAGKAYNDPVYCAALGDLYARDAGNWTQTKGWSNASQGIPTDYCDFYGVRCQPMPTTAPLLTGIELMSNGLDGLIPASLGSITSLNTLRLNNNLLRGTLPASLSSLTALGWLDLSHNYFSGSVPVSWVSLSALSFLYLQTNDIGGSFPALPKSIVQLNLSTKYFTGTLPAAVGDLTNLRELDLSDNGFNGAIPAAFSALTSLETLRLSGSGLCGGVPSSHQPDDGGLPPCSLAPGFTCASFNNQIDCTALGDLWATTNGSGWARTDGWALAAAGKAPSICAGAAFFGVVCDSSTPARVVQIRLSGNKLSGSIAPSLGSVSFLQILDLSTNTLSGSVPSTFSSLTSLTQLYLSKSGLCGSVPSPHQPDDGRLRGCPATGAKAVVIDTVLIVSTIWAGIVSVIVGVKIWQARQYILNRKAVLAEADGAGNGIAPLDQVGVVDGQEEDVTALKEALLPPGEPQSSAAGV